jgi:hypothetical protein
MVLAKKRWRRLGGGGVPGVGGEVGHKDNGCVGRKAAPWSNSVNFILEDGFRGYCCGIFSVFRLFFSGPFGA